MGGMCIARSDDLGQERMGLGGVGWETAAYQSWQETLALARNAWASVWDGKQPHNEMTALARKAWALCRNAVFAMTTAVAQRMMAFRGMGWALVTWDGRECWCRAGKDRIEEQSGIILTQGSQDRPE
eukprot:1114757-Pelagomonas_calceolata.AAC.10